jgi:asparagine synthetase B (glutamine-hydrolysing)
MRDRASSGTIVIRGFERPGAIEWSTGRRIPRRDLGFDDGAWASWDWDGTTLAARTGPHGSIPLYWAHLSDGIVLSPSIHDVLSAGAARAFDWEALAVAIRIGGFLEERTAFRGIRILPPAAEFRWSGDAPSIASNARRDPPVEEDLTFAEAVDAYLDLVAAAVRRRQPGAPFAMPLSGGRDSRHLLLELLAQGHRPAVVLTSRHYLIDSATDVAAAVALAGRLGVPHEVLSVPPYSFARQLELCRRVDYTTYDQCGHSRWPSGSSASRSVTMGTAARCLAACFMAAVRTWHWPRPTVMTS